MSQDSQNGLQEYLESERQEGTVLSEGAFRVDWQKAQQKTRDFAFEKPHQWICRYIQALTLLENQTLDVRYGRKKFHLQASLAQALPPPEKLLVSQQRRGLQAFRDALWGAHKRDLQVTLSWTDTESKTWRLEFNEGGISLSTLKAPLNSVHLKASVKSFRSKLAALFWRGQFVSEYRELTKACRTLSFPLIVDSRPYVPVECYSKEYPLWVARYRESEQGFPLHNRYLNGDFENWPTNMSPWPTKKTDILVLMRYVPIPRPVEYYWVIDGLPISIESGPLTGGPPKPTSCVETQIYISAGGLGTDLSGLKVVKNRVKASKLINDALRLIASAPPLAFVDPLSRVESEWSLMTCFRTVMGQCENIVRQPCMGDTSGAFYREDLMRKVRRAGESRIKGRGKRNAPPGLWEAVRKAYRDEMK